MKLDDRQKYQKMSVSELRAEIKKIETELVSTIMETALGKVQNRHAVKAARTRLAVVNTMLSNSLKTEKLIIKRRQSRKPIENVAEEVLAITEG